MWVLVFIIIVLLAVVVVLSTKVYSLKCSVKEIAEDLSEHISNDTNTLIDVSVRDKQVRKLVVTLNQQLKILRRQYRRYQRGNYELTEAVTNISHDLRTPLTAICGYLDLLEKQSHSEDTVRYIEQIRNRSEILKQLTEELFRYSVLLSLPELSYKKVNLCQVLEETLLSFEAAFSNASIVPNIQLPSHPIWRELDVSALTRIFNNITNNAVKYSDGDFYVVLDENGIITFTNSAKELSIVEVGKLFDRFYTVDSARKSTGLGLSIAKLLTERMNGSIRAEYISDKLNIIVSFPNN